MFIEVMSWEEIQALPGFDGEELDTSSTYWNLDKEADFVRFYPDRIVELLNDEPDEDGDYECVEFFYPPDVIKQFLPNHDLYGTHKILRRSLHVKS